MIVTLAERPVAVTVRCRQKGKNPIGTRRNRKILFSTNAAVGGNIYQLTWANRAPKE
jgi:hypothetical protein